MAGASKARVVIIGAGFGGLAAARRLAGSDVDVTLIDRQNHHLFQPLLYQVATAGLSPADIAAPIRSIFKGDKNVRVILENVKDVDTAAKQVVLQNCAPVPYDYLVVATGARHSYFANGEWEKLAPGLKTIDDATRIRRAVLLALENAEVETDKELRNALLTYVVIGGGPTGVEMAGAIAELAHKSVSMDFRHITPHCSRVILVDSGQRLLKAFPEDLSRRAQESLEGLGVEIRLGQRISDLRDHGVKIGEEWVAAQTIVWAAGVKASPAARWLGIEGDRGGKVPVRPCLRPEQFDDVYVIGDVSTCPDADGKPLPGIAAVAKQQGRHAAAHILAEMGAAKEPGPFRYRNYGSIATIGRRRAVADFGRFKASGLLAWFIWSVVHIWFLAGYRNRMVVAANWFWSYLTLDRSARLITGLGQASVIRSNELGN